MIQYSDNTHPTCKRSPDESLAAEYLAAVHALDASIAAGDDAAEQVVTAEIARLEDAFDALDERERTRDLGKVALGYARNWGWPVFPLVPGTKEPLTAHGFKDATTDPTRIAAWWRETPEANIGLPTGLRFDVLDVDWRTKDGQLTGAHEAWPKLRDSGALPDIHGKASTARSGLHIYLEPTGTGNRARMGGVGLDYRGKGGYVVAPPSRMPVGSEIGLWSWAVVPSPMLTGQSAQT